MTYNAHPFQLLEINVISAQDLAPVSKSMRTYAVVWVHPERKLTTRIDQSGNTNPQWNEKFVFRVDDTFLNSETSGIMIEIYAAAWLRDVQIGSVRVLISNLFPSNNNNSKMRFVALQIRRPSGRPQGILNMGVQLLDNTMRSMPLYTELSASAVGFNDLIDAKTNKQSIEEKTAKLRRTQSDHTDFTTTADEFGVKGSLNAKSSVVNGSSLVNSSTLKTSSRDKDTGTSGNGNGSMVNGSLCSDVGPSASVVAAAIAKGLIKTPGNEDGSTTGGEDRMVQGCLHVLVMFLDVRFRLLVEEVAARSMETASKLKSKQLSEESRETTIQYRECRRNHAVLIGGYAADGCGEFTPKGDQGTKEALLCEACDCHRNFHRKEFIKNGTALLGSQHLPPPHGLYYPMWKEGNAPGFYPLPPLSSQPPLSPYCHYYWQQNVQNLVCDEESVTYNGSQNDGQMKAGKRHKRKLL
ncbi:hypothetical protein GH714_001364 [Hevea brasiliensis]|uniref:C2 domain-containing protein n=1 Tax=Hevea brasiliensis TaxID=3981 RepID=A0A6A6KH11_HEVBR|nr:hypothetical protein GH714_001364 [Hevea brasiliensis]